MALGGQQQLLQRTGSPRPQHAHGHSQQVRALVPMHAHARAHARARAHALLVPVPAHAHTHPSWWCMVQDGMMTFGGQLQRTGSPGLQHGHSPQLQDGMMAFDAQQLQRTVSPGPQHGQQVHSLHAQQLQGHSRDVFYYDGW